MLASLVCVHQYGQIPTCSGASSSGFNIIAPFNLVQMLCSNKPYRVSPIYTTNPPPGLNPTHWLQTTWSTVKIKVIVFPGCSGVTLVEDVERQVQEQEISIFDCQKWIRLWFHSATTALKQQAPSSLLTAGRKTHKFLPLHGPLC